MKEENLEKMRKGQRGNIREWQKGDDVRGGESNLTLDTRHTHTYTLTERDDVNQTDDDANLAI